MRDFLTTGTVDVLRSDFDPAQRDIATIDTMVAHSGRATAISTPS
jgi:hypothetical protein